MPQVKSIFLIDTLGHGVNSSRPDFIRQLDMTERSFFRYFMDGGSDEIFISRPEKARVDGQWTYYASIRLLDAAGRIRGVLVASISISYFESLYASLGLDFVSRIQLLDREGLLLAGKPHDEEMFGKITANPSAQAMLRAKPESAIHELTENSPAGRRYVAYRQIAKYPLVVSAAVDEDEALIPWYRVVRPLLAGVILVILFVLVTTFLLVRNLLRKGALESALKESDEQLRHMVPVGQGCHRDPELGEACRSIQWRCRADVRHPGGRGDRQRDRKAIIPLPAPAATDESAAFSRTGFALARCAGIVGYSRMAAR